MPSMSERDRFVSLVARLAFDFRSQVESETLHSAILHVYDRLREQLEAQSVTYQDNLTEIQLLKAQLENYNNAIARLLEAWSNRGETTSLHQWNTRMEAAIVACRDLVESNRELGVTNEQAPQS